MAKIQILPESIASKIAAGEVVQRPESVVKELIENSIDAGANHVSLVIKDAGKSLIQVIDDGSGMSKEEVSLAFQRHSTSKISTLEDLNNIQTLGFRGEALYSISAVARVEVKTKTEDSELGAYVVFEDGKEVENSVTSCEKGTNISVKNLFFNLPARRKFLKSNATEFKHIYDTFQRVVFSYPNIRFTLIDDEKLVFDLKPSSLEKRIQYFYGESFLESLIAISENFDEMNIYGYIGAPHFARKNRGEQFLFLNNRFIQNKSINHAVYRGYEHLIEKGEFPFFMLFLTINPQKIDVNVHPAKLEVKFDDEQIVYSTILSAVRNSLTKFDISPSIELVTKNGLNEKTKFKSPTVEMNTFLAKEIYGIKNPNLIEAKRDFTIKIDEQVENLFSKNSIIEQTRNLIGNESANINEITTDVIPSRAVWQIHNKYILTPIKSGLMIIDQHIAHERILYEKAIERIENNIAPSQQLLFPQTIELSTPDFDLVMELKDLLIRLGFDFKQFGKSTIVIEGIPQEIQQGKEKETLLEILEQFREYSKTEVLNQRDNLAKSFACKTAIKAGDQLTEKEMLSLIDNLFVTKVPYICPHGRPVIIKLSLDELDRRFGRSIN